ncbi:MAG: hypothetical protein WCC38_03245 [Pseudonocardiaceae bacterium]
MGSRSLLDGRFLSRDGGQGVADGNGASHHCYQHRCGGIGGEGAATQSGLMINLSAGNVSSDVYHTKPERTPHPSRWIICRFS